MIRFVRAPDGAVTPDIRSRLPGRGVWVTARADLVAEAARKQAFSRGLKAKAEAAPTLARDVDALLEADCLQMLALANKAGLVITGFGKVATALEKGEARALIEAINGGEDGRRKVMQCVRRGAAATGATPKIVTLFASGQLDLALGRTNVIHAALATGGPAEAFLSRYARLTLYRGGTTADSAAREDAENDVAPGGNADALENLMGMGRTDPRSDSE
jgi:predicted RNA-binding protein YlxR (DUF448 family)